MKGKTWSRYVFVFAVCTLLIAGSFGLPHFGMSEEMHGEGHMAMKDCYMPGMTAICAMSPLEHIASWQTMFTAAFIDGLIVIALAILTLVLTRLSLGVAALSVLRSAPVSRSDYIPISPLRELYSRGILNPKVY